MNLIADIVQATRGMFVGRRALGLVPLLVISASIAACSDGGGPVQSATQTASAAEFDVYQSRVHAEETATLSPRTPVPTAPADACKLLTKEEVVAAIGKPMEPATNSRSGMCSYQGDAEFLSVVAYSGMTEDDARKLFNSKYVNPGIVTGDSMHFYVTEREIDNLGDEALIASNPGQSEGVRRVIYVREGNQLFYIQWFTSVTDKDVTQVLTELATKVLSRL